MTIKNIRCDILIIGAGPAGLAAGVYAARAGKRTVILEGRAASRLGLGYEIENYPGFISIGSLDLLEKFRGHAVHFGAEILKGDVVALAIDSAPKYVTTGDAFIEAGAVIVATGRPFARERMIPGEERLTGQGVSYCATCDGPLYRGLDVAAYGHSEEAVEDIETLRQLGCRVTWLTGRYKDPAFPESRLEEARRNGIRVFHQAEIREIGGDRRVEYVAMEKDGQREELRVSAVFIFREIPTGPLLGKAGLDLDHKQCIAVDRFQRTNLEGVFAAGDVTCGGLQIVTAAGEGCTAALQALGYLRQRG
ncbi:MAG: FAD-dependent oxidoreductase [Acidobacteriota bacterium]|nr:FAD-dependent oxidoreductase [Acidobacteriota bacterium]